MGGPSIKLLYLSFLKNNTQIVFRNHHFQQAPNIKKKTNKKETNTENTTRDAISALRACTMQCRFGERGRVQTNSLRWICIYILYRYTCIYIHIYIYIYTHFVMLLCFYRPLKIAVILVVHQTRGSQQNNTPTHKHMYIYIYVCIRVCLLKSGASSWLSLEDICHFCLLWFSG